VIDKVRHVKDIQLADFEYLKSQVGCAGLHAQGHHPVAHHAALPRRARRHQPRRLPRAGPGVLRRRGQSLWRRAASAGDAGCTYVQMDDTNLAYLCDEKMREAARQRGDDPNELPHRYAGSSTRWWRTSRPA
jgi:5-methyltetrahydropteroyltriglutamate--homocysteine methyltransferase